MNSQAFLISNEDEQRRVYINDVLFIKIEDYLLTFHLKHEQNYTVLSHLIE